MIVCRKAHKGFAGKPILQDISVTFQQGKTNLVIGKSGCGKSVFLKCLIGLIPLDLGSIWYESTLLDRENKLNMRHIRRHIGMLFQGSALFDSQTVEENVQFPLDILTTMTSKEKANRVGVCLDRVGLSAASKKLPAELSGGMKKRVGIARAIVNNPQYLFCDEPNSGLDPQTSILIDQLIYELTKENNMTTIVVTHDMNSVMEIGDYIVFFSEGKKAWEGSKEDILKADVQSLEDFIFSSSLVRSLRDV